MTSHNAKKKRSLPVIDLGLFGRPQAAPRLITKSSNITHNNENKEANLPKNSSTRAFVRKDRAAVLGKPREMMMQEEDNDSAMRHTEGTSNPGAQMPFQETMQAGNSGAVNDSSRVMTKSHAVKPSGMPVKRHADPHPHSFDDSKMPAKPTEEQPRSEALELHVDDTKTGKVGDMKAGSVGDTKEDKMESSASTQVMPNRNICVPLVPVPSVCSTKLEGVQSVSLPGFQQLINYNYFGQKTSEDGNKTCVMCGVTRQYLLLKRDHKDELPFILFNNKGVCSACQDIVWVVVDSKLEIRFCVKCKAFLPWAAFQKDGLMVKSCSSCRENTSKARKKRAATEKETPSSTTMPTSAVRCVMLPQPAKLPPPSTLEETSDIPLPSFDLIVNYPAFLRKPPDKNGNKCCVMCSKSLPFLMRSGQDGSDHRIARNNNGICTVCEATVWQLVETGIQIKWCNRCNHFRPWAAYLGDDNTVKKRCSHCRRYAVARHKKSSSSIAAVGGDAAAIAPDGCP